MYTYPPNEVIAQKIRKYYKEERGIIRVSPPEGYKTVSIEKLKAVPNIDEREYAQAMGVMKNALMMMLRMLMMTMPMKTGMRV